MDALKLVADNPNLFGILAFMIVFIPVLRYIINWAEKTTAENREIYSTALQKSEHREEKLQIFIEGKIADHTSSLERMNDSQDRINANMEKINNSICDLSGRVEHIERKNSKLNLKYVGENHV